MRPASATALLGILACPWLAGCGSAPPDASATAAPQDGPLAECRRLFRATDHAVAAAGVADAQSARVAGFPYLRLSRFMASGPDVAPHGAAFEGWVDGLRALDRRARRAELANLPTTHQAPPLADLDRCAATLRRHDLSSAAAREQLLDARVPDDYRLGLRVLGLYPVTSVPFLLGVYALHGEIRATFDTPRSELAIHGKLRRVAPPESATAMQPGAVAAMLRRSSEDLGVPDPRGEDLARLFAAFAPVWEIDTAVPADRPGSPRLGSRARPEVLGAPVVYTLASHTRWQGRTLLQLNYVIWFPARPRTGPLDLVGGHLDGITWRVTLGTDGRPLLYDAMHNCGCYYKAFPTPRLRVGRRHSGWQEPIAVPQPVADGPGRIVLRIASGSHYIQRVHRSAGPAASRYELADYDALRSLPLPGGGRRSLFGSDGIVPGSERRERWVFWPMGVPEPGAMRQWGNHAIAFVGRRHFDDPALLERHFVPAGTE